MEILTGHPTLVILARSDPAGLHIGNEVFLNCPEVVELLIEMAGQQQDGVFQFAFAIAQRTLTEIAGHDGRADHDCRNQECAANDKPADRTAANRSFDVGGGGAVCRHWT